MTPLMTMREALADESILGSAFRRRPGAPDSWLAWRALSIGMMGEELTTEERQVWRELTALQREPYVRCEEVAILKGRRSGGTTAMAATSFHPVGAGPPRSRPSR